MKPTKKACPKSLGEIAAAAVATAGGKGTGHPKRKYVLLPLIFDAILLFDV